MSTKDELFGSKDDIPRKNGVLKSLAFMVFSISNGKECLSRFSWYKRRNSIRKKDDIFCFDINIYKNSGLSPKGTSSINPVLEEIM